MKLQGKKVRLPIAALGVTALCTGGVGIFAAPAFAATEIALNSGASSIAVGNFGTSATETANAAYALKVGESSVANTVLAVTDAPDGGRLSYEKVAANGAATANGFTNVGDVRTAEVQELYFDATPDTGSYVVNLGSTTTDPILGYTAADLQAALRTEWAGNTGITVTGSGTSVSPFRITFGGTLAGTNYAQITITKTGLADGATPVNETISTATNGSVNTNGYSSTGTLANSDYVYVTGTVPGTYKFRIFQDTNANNVFDSADERSTSLVTLNVYDTNGATVATGDDVNPTFTTTSPVGAGDAISAEVGFSKSLSLSDARGSVAENSLINQLAGLTWIDVTAGAGVGAMSNQHPTVASGKLSYSVGTPNAAGTVTLKGLLQSATPANPAAYPTTGSKAVTVTSNSVAALTPAVTKVEGSVIGSGSTATVKTGTSSVEYTATAVDNSVPAKPVAGAKITFTLSGSDANVAKLSADGVAVNTAGTTKVYTATTNAAGVATLKVTSSDTTAGFAYDVSAASNSQSGSITTTYAAATIDKVVTTSTSAELTPAVGAASVALKGKLVDQFGGAFVPSSSTTQQVTVTITGGPYYAPVSNTGTFSYDYKPATAATAGDTTPFTLTYNGVSTTGEQIQWASTAAASKINLTAPADAAKDLLLQDNTAPDATQISAFGNTAGQLAGTVLGADNAALAYKSVTFTGGEGVWFATSGTPDATHPLKDSITLVSDASGVVSGGYVFFTKAGEQKVTATSGSTTVTSTVTVKDAATAQAYNVTINDVSGAPGSTLIVTGKVTDIFGNAVPEAFVNLTQSAAGVGALGNSSPRTNAAGVFSTTYVSGSNSSGDVDLTATLDNPTALTADAAYKTAGITLADGKKTATGSISIAKTDLTIAVTGKVTAGGSGANTKISGKFLPSTSVDIYSKAAGERAYTLLDSVKTNAAGSYSLTDRITKSTFFLAKSNGQSSGSKATQVSSKVSLTAKALGKGKVKLSANGDPNVKATLTFYNGTKVLKKITSNAAGVGSATVTLPKGKKTVKVTFKAPGTNQGQKTISVTVK